MSTERLSTRGRVYVAVVACVGLAAIGQSFYALYAHRIGWDWFVLALLMLISGSATVKLPSVPATISVSETFVFTSVLLFGPAAGTLTVALDALVISLWLARRGHPFYRIAFNVCALPTALWISAHIFYAVAPISPLAGGEAVKIGTLIVPLAIFTVCYFLLNSWLITFAISFEKRLPPFPIWRGNFAWLSLNYFGGASVAALLVTYTRNIDFAYVAFVLPLLAVLYVTFVTSMGRVEDANKHLSQLNTLYMSTIETLAMAIDAKDQITHGHIRRVQQYAVKLAQAIGIEEADQIKAIEAASLLHDMGKLAVPEYILNKPGALTPAEFEKMKLHASVGADILSSIEFPYPVVPIVRHHHENWDGSGYPDGLRGGDIPIGARILSVVDCFDALTSDRPYRPRLPDSEAIAILMERRGRMYDPLVVDTFIEVYREIAPAEAQRTTSAAAGLSAITRSSTPSSVAAGESLDDIAGGSEETLVLYELARQLTGHLTLTEAADAVVKNLRRIIPAATYVFFVYDSRSDELVVAHAVGEHSPDFAGLRIPRGERLSGWVGANKRSIINSDPVLDLGEVARTRDPRLRSCMSTPLTVSSELVGVLTVYSTVRDGFTEDHRRIVEVVARQLAPSVRQVAGGSLERPIQEGELTAGLPSLVHLERLVAAELAATSGIGPLAVLLVTIPASFSDAASVELFSRLVSAIQRALRGGDILFKYRDGEFALLLTHTDRNAALAVARRIEVGLARIAVDSTPLLRGTACVGVATAPIDGTSAEELLAAARQVLRFTSIPSEPLPRSIH